MHLTTKDKIVLAFGIGLGLLLLIPYMGAGGSANNIQEEIPRREFRGKSGLDRNADFKKPATVLVQPTLGTEAPKDFSEEDAFEKILGDLER